MANSDWPEMKTSATRKPRCAEAGCENTAAAKGLCMMHYNRRKSKQKKAAERISIEIPESGTTQRTETTGPHSEPPKEAPRKEERPNADTIKGMIIVTMSTLAVTLDESFSVIDSHGNELPHVKDAVAQMTPFLEKYAGSLAALSPYIGFAMGAFALGAPAFGPVTEIIAGVRKPRMFRKGAQDVYTDQWKRAEARRAEKKGNDDSASSKTVEVEGVKAAA